MSKYFLPDNQVGIHPDLIIALLQKLLLICIFNIWMGLLQDSNNTAREPLTKKLPAELLRQWTVQAQPVQSLQNLHETVDRRRQVARVRL